MFPAVKYEDFILKEKYNNVVSFPFLGFFFATVSTFFRN